MSIKKILSSFSKKLMPNNTFNKGFTFIEMLIIVPIAILTIGIFVAAIVNMTGEVLAVRGTNALTYDIQTALNKIEQDVSLSGAYLATNSIDLATAPYQGYDNGSTYNASTTNFHNADATNGAMLILNSYTTASNPLDTTRNIVYTSAQPNACNSGLVNQNPPVMINIIYFIKNNTLWRRIIVPSYYETVGCIGTSVGIPWQQSSCAIGVSGTLCKTQDVRLVDNVKASDFSISYYAGSDSTAANTTTSDSAQTDGARSAALQTTNTVGVSITAKTTIAGREISQSGSIRAVSPNNNRTLTVSTTSPDAPTGLTATGGSHQEVLTWTAPINNGGYAITGYKIYRGNTSNSEIFLIKVGNVLTYTDTTNLNSSTTYYYKIAAVNSIGEGVLSSEANGITSVPVTVTFNPTSTGQTGTIQNWTVPSTGLYTIEVWGAQGGQGTGYTQYANGKGARMRGTFSLTSGTVLKILVGQQGPSGTYDGGGGGGTFVTDNSNNPLIIAGGGGGSSYSGAGVDAVTTNAGTAGASGGTGGTSGLGGSSAGYAGAGGGLTTNGGYGPSSSSTCTGGISFIGNGNGGCTVSTTTGGYGGGGGTHGGGWGGGGGGGYSGGGASTSSQYGGGGGGSYNSGTNQSNTAGARASSGLATITY